jgi:hypothetical protein
MKIEQYAHNIMAKKSEAIDSAVFAILRATASCYGALDRSVGNPISFGRWMISWQIAGGKVRLYAVNPKRETRR